MNPRSDREDRVGRREMDNEFIRAIRRMGNIEADLLKLTHAVFGVTEDGDRGLLAEMRATSRTLRWLLLSIVGASLTLIGTATAVLLTRV